MILGARFNNFPINFSTMRQRFQLDSPSKAIQVRSSNCCFTAVWVLTIAFNTYLKLDADPQLTPWWKLYGGLEVPIGVSIDIFSHVVVGYSTVVIDFRKIIAQAQTVANKQAKAVATGAFHTCALTVIDNVKCWGNNHEGQLGDGTTVQRRKPVSVCSDSSCASTLSGVMAITTGSSFTCALTTNGGVKCWGTNSEGELGDGNGHLDTFSQTPVDVSGLTSGVTMISSGESHACALISGGSVKCWGDNSLGQLGDNSWTDRSTPVDVCSDVSCTAVMNGVQAITAGGRFTCALMISDAVKCWGANGFGELGDGNGGNDHVSGTPVDVIGLVSGVTAITAEGSHACALITDSVKCWGNNEDGEIGDGGGGVPCQEFNYQFVCRFTPTNVVGG